MVSAATWTLIRDDAAERFGEHPGNRLEQDLIDAYEQHPRRVIELIDRIAAKRAAGSPIRSPWAVIHHELANAPAPVAPNVEAERQQRITNAEAWIRTTGLHLPETEMLAHLFGDEGETAPLDYLKTLEQQTRDTLGRSHYAGLLEAAITKTEDEGPQPLPQKDGKLSAYDTPQLRKRLTDLWREHRPRGIAAQEDAERRALERVELRSKLQAKSKEVQELGVEPEYDDDPNWHHTPEPEPAAEA